MEKMSEREEFEKWALSKQYSIAEFESSGAYISEFTHWRWEAWQACSLLSQEVEFTQAVANVCQEAETKAIQLMEENRLLRMEVDNLQNSVKEKTTDIEHEKFKSSLLITSYEAELRMLKEEKESAASAVPAGYKLVPIQATAENGMKAALIGEFIVTVTIADEENEEEYQQEYPIPWTTIKEIYRQAILAAPTIPASKSENILVDAIEVVATTQLPNTINIQSYDGDGNKATFCSRSSSNPNRDVHIMNAAIEFVYAIARGVDIDPNTLYKHLTGHDFTASKPHVTDINVGESDDPTARMHG